MATTLKTISGAIRKGLKKIADGKVTVSMDELTTAFNKVRRELEDHNVLFDGSPLDEVDCYNGYLDPSGLTGTQGYCPPNGDIYVPYVYPFAIWGEERDVVDVIRHEFGHAMADRYTKYFTGRKNKIFKDAFGAEYSDQPADPEDTGYLMSRHISAYAPKATREDWAETFMYFLRYKGRIPAKWSRYPIIKKKWQAVRAIIKLVAAECV